MSTTQSPIRDLSVASEAERAAATASQLGGGRFGFAADGRDLRAGGRQPRVVGVDLLLQLLDPVELDAHRVADLFDPGRHRLVGFLDLLEVVGAGVELVDVGGAEDHVDLARHAASRRSPPGACRARLRRGAACAALRSGGCRERSTSPPSSAERSSPSASRALSFSSRAPAASARSLGGGEFALGGAQLGGQASRFALGRLDLRFQRADVGRGGDAGRRAGRRREPIWPRAGEGARAAAGYRLLLRNPHKLTVSCNGTCGRRPAALSPRERCGSPGRRPPRAAPAVSPRPIRIWRR